MAEFKVDTVQLQNYASQISALQGNLDAVALKLGGMQLGSILRIKASTALVGKIADCKWAAVNQSNNLGKLARGLEDVAELYTGCEKNLSDPKTQTQADAIAAENAPSFWEQLIDHRPSWQEIVKWIGKGCAPVGIISSIISFSEGNPKGIISGLKAICSATGPITKAVSAGGWSDGLMNLFGFSAQGVGGLSESWNKWLNGMNLGKQTTTAGKVGTVAKWGGYVLTALGNVVDNVEEYNGDVSMTVGRAVGETIVETGVDIGLSIGAGVLIAAALPATAPAIVVGAAAAGVVWAANEVCEWITGGDDLGEVVANAVCDGVEAVGNFVGDAVDTIAEGASAAWNGICNWAGGLFA